MPRLLHRPESLEEARDKVLAQPQGTGGQAFARATLGLEGLALVKKVQQFIGSPDAIDLQIKDIKKGAPYLLTIEDYVSRWGLPWRFDPAYIDMAKMSVKRYDRAAEPANGEPNRYETGK